MNLGKSIKTIAAYHVFALLCAGFLLSPSFPVSPAQSETAPVFRDVMFDSDQEGFSESARQALDDNVETLKNNPAYVVKLEGYSDRTGSDDYNMEISLKRALKVSEYLIRAGIDPSRIEALGMGETDKFGAGETNEALGRNRRVVFVARLDESLVPPEPPAASAESVQTDTDDVKDEPSEASDESGTREDEENAASGHDAADRDSSDETDKELPPLPDDIENAVKDGIIRLAPGEILFETPVEMRTGKTYILQVEVPNSFVKELTDNLKNSSKDMDGLVISKDVIIRLTGDSFEFEPVEETPPNPDEEINESGFISESVSEYTNWQWLVRPTASGYQTLVASIIVNIEYPRFIEDDVRAETFQKVIYVKPGIIESIMSSYLTVTIMSALILAIVVWIGFRLYNSRRSV